MNFKLCKLYLILHCDFILFQSQGKRDSNITLIHSSNTGNSKRNQEYETQSGFPMWVAGNPALESLSAAPQGVSQQEAGLHWHRHSDKATVEPKPTRQSYFSNEGVLNSFKNVTLKMNTNEDSFNRYSRYTWKNLPDFKITYWIGKGSTSLRMNKLKQGWSLCLGGFICSLQTDFVFILFCYLILSPFLNA